MTADGAANTPGAGDESSAPFEPARLGPITLRNRFIKAATFEGASPKGQVTDDLVDFHRRVGEGGAAMTTVAYLAVSPEGRTDRHCIVVRDDVLPGLQGLTDAVHDTGAAVAAQLGHAGPVANPRSNRAPSVAPSRHISPLGTVSRAITEAEIARITADYGHAARMVIDAGFDSIEVHLGHNYLLSAFLSPKLNRRRDRWGGSVENRARFARQVVRTVREAVGERAAVTAKLNMADGVPGGCGSRTASRWPGCSRPTAPSTPSRSPAAARSPTPCTSSGARPPVRSSPPRCPGRSASGSRCWGTGSCPTTPSRRRSSFPTPVSSGLRSTCRSSCSVGSTSSATVERALAEGFSFVAMARALLREPDLVSKMARRHLACLTVHPLQQVHAHHLQRYPLRPRPRRPPHRSDGPHPARRELNNEDRH